MIRAVAGRWTCSTCRKSIQAARSFSTSRKVSQRAQAVARRSEDSSSGHNDQLLRDVFDNQLFWRDFSKQTTSLHAEKKSSRGLFRNVHLTSPAGFQTFAQANLGRAESIVARVLAANSADELRRIARDMDRLSDLLCRVIDVADFVRMTHPSTRMQAAATEAYSMMFEYMNVLNTTTGLNDQLKRALSDPEVSKSWSEEEKIVAKVLLRDFSKSAIHMPPVSRQRFVDLSNDVSRLGAEYVDFMEPETPYISVDSRKLRGMDPLLVRKLSTRATGLTWLPTTGYNAIAALRTIDDEKIRKQLYMAHRTGSKKQIGRVEEFLVKRAELARIAGFDSYAELALSDKMAKTPENVGEFLRAISGELAPIAQQEMHLLRSEKLSRHPDAPPKLTAWDKEYYMQHYISRQRSRLRSPDFLSSYFSLGTVMQGLSRLFNSLYGVRLVPAEITPNETWNSDVRRLDIIDDTAGHVGVLYCDLFERPGKNPNPAHFTLRCSRRITQQEIQELASDPNINTDIDHALNDGMATSHDPRGGLFQLPTIALICDFARISGSASQTTLLSFKEVQTLFHEMGHAIHSFLGRTELQTIAGTRCATDFVELPSVLMERFAADPSVLALFARHHETGEPLPYEMVESYLAQQRAFEALGDVSPQILLAQLDQALHGNLQIPFSSTATYHDIFGSSTNPIPEPSGTSYQAFFGHIVTYGATYYSYLFDRALAAMTWNKVFASGDLATQREAGETFKEGVLKWGGAKDGWECMAALLGDQGELIEQGDAKAMATVARWAGGTV